MTDTDLLSLAASPRGLVQGGLSPDGAVALKWVEASDARWVRLGGPSFAAAPAVVSDRQGRLWVFARDTEGVIHANVRQNNLGWSGWQAFDGTITAGPCACLDAGGRVVVFGRGTDGALWHKWLDGATWSAWSSLGGAIQHAPAAVLTIEGRLTVFVVGTDNALYHQFYDNGWSGWHGLDGQLTGSPAAVIDGVGVLRVFGRGTDGALWTRHYDLGWQPWQGLGGGLASAPAAATARTGRLHVRVVGTDGTSIHERAVITAWEEYALIDRLPSVILDRDVEAVKIRQWREERKKDPAVLRLAQFIVDGVRLMHARGVTAAVDPGRFAALGDYEREVAKRFATRSPELQARLSQLAQVEIDRFAELRAQRPEMWGKIDLAAGPTLTAQLASSLRTSGLADEKLVAQKVSAKIPAGDLGRGARRLVLAQLEWDTPRLGKSSRARRAHEQEDTPSPHPRPEN